tara:strand:+ start:2891 stop:3265 length:375 start_codon:yes stop_codon:yes gene_type:complete
MNITPKTLGFAIHRIMVVNRVTRGCSISMKDMLEAWRETLLRRRDLVDGLEALRKSGHLALEQTPDGPQLRMLDESFGLIRTERDREALSQLNRLRNSRSRPTTHLGQLTPKKTGRRGDDPKVG